MQQCGAAHIGRAQIGVGGLCGHTDDVGVIRKIPAAWRISFWKKEPAFMAGFAGLVGLPENMGIVQRCHHMDRCPAKWHGGKCHCERKAIGFRFLVN